MKKYSFKNLFAIILTAVMLLTTVFSGGILSVLADDKLFSDDFKSDKLSGWASDAIGKVTSGKYYLEKQQGNVITAVEAKENLWLSADVTVNIGANDKGILQNSIASLVINADEDLTKGYEFGIGVNKSGKTYTRLYLRGEEDESRILVQKNTDIPGVDGGVISSGKSYNLSIGYYNGTINCFINGELALTYTDTTLTKGYCAIKTSYSSSVFDNVSIKAIPEKKVNKIVINSASTSISRLGEFECELYVTYKNDFHQAETVTHKDPRVSVRLSSRAVGTSKATITFEGKNVTSQVKITDVVEDKLIYSDDFSKDTSSKYSVYPEASNAKADFRLAYNKGALTAAPKLSDGMNSHILTKATLDVDSVYEALGDFYKISVDGAIYTEVSGTSTNRKTFVEMVAFTDANANRYKYRIYSDGKASLYRESEILVTTSLNALGENSFEMGKTFNMSVSALENIVVCSFNGQDIIYYTIPDMAKCKAEIYIAGADGSIKLDNLKVSSLEKYDSSCARRVTVYSATDNQKLSTYIGKKLSIDKLYLVITYFNGMKRTVGLTEDMISGYDANKAASQVVTVTYGSATTNINFNYSKYLFYDNFDEGLNPTWKTATAANISTKVNNGKLVVTWNGESSNAQITYTTENIEGYENWRNYEASVDFAYNASMAKNTKAGSLFSLVFRKVKNTYFDLRLQTRSGKLIMYLYRYVDGKSAKVGEYSTNTINSVLPSGKLADNGTSFNIKVLCKENDIYIYIDNILLDVYTEVEENGPHYGACGLKLFKASGTVDNFIVEEKQPTNIVRFDVAGLKNNVFEIYEGQEICTFDYSLNGYDADGTVLQEYLTDDMVSPYDNLELGAQNIVITAFGGIKKTFTLVVKQRNDFIEQLDKDIKALDLNKLELSDKETVYELESRYDLLSEYEISKLSKASVEKLAKARIKIYKLVYPEIKDDDVLYTNDFNEKEDKNLAEWSKGYQTSKGVFMFDNGTYRLEQKRYNIYHGAWRVYEPLYGELSSVSCDFLMLGPDEYPGVAMNITREGHYLARVKMDTYDDYGNVKPMLQVLRNDTRVFAVYLSGYGVNITQNEWFNITMTLVDGNINVYVKDTLIVSFNDSESILYHTEGRASIYGSGGNWKADNFVVTGTKKDEPTSAVKAEPTIYKDDFEDEKANSDPSHWVEVNTDDNWKTVKKDKNTYYGTSYIKGYTYTWLHVFDSDPTVELDFMSDKANKGGYIGFVLRKSTETSYMKLCYDWDSSKWYLVETRAERDTVVNTTYSDIECKLEKGKWYKAKIVALDDSLVLTVDGKKVFELKEGISQKSWGNVGALANGASMYIDNVNCTFPDGGVVQDGVIQYIADNDHYGLAPSPVYTKNGEVIFPGDSWLAYSSDYAQTTNTISGSGLSEEELSSDKALVDRFTPMDGNDGYNTVLKLHDGTYLQIKLMDNDEFNKGGTVYRSTDDCKTWTKISYVEEDAKDELGRRKYTIHNSSLTEVKLSNGKYRLFLPVAMVTYASNLTTTSGGHYTVVYYSDDNGYTWQTSKNDTRDVMLGYDQENYASEWGEAKVIGCSDGSLRMYMSRSDFGCITYTESFDNGETWEGHYPIPEMQCAQSSYCVVEDEYERGTFYIIWVNNNAVKTGSSFSRTRLSLARSYDGKNWEFLCDITRMEEEVYDDAMESGTQVYWFLQRRMCFKLYRL